jgi:hypothetical protein
MYIDVLSKLTRASVLGVSLVTLALAVLSAT